MALPHDLYIRFLITLGYDSLGDINRELGSLLLPQITVNDMNRQVGFIEQTVPKNILAQIEKKVYGSGFLKWMKELEIEEFWYSQGVFAKDFPSKKVDYTLAKDINKDPQLRLTITALLMKGMKAYDLIPIVAGKFAAPLKEQQIILFQKYFFRFEVMTRESWRAYLGKLPNEEKQIYFQALTEDIEVVKTELGISARFSASDNLQFLLQKSMAKARKYLMLDSPTADKEARAWISQITDLTDKYEKYKSSDTADFGKALQLEFDYVEVEYPVPDNDTLEALSEATKRREMQMKKEAGDDEEDDSIVN